jgi:hypothetical protein
MKFSTLTELLLNTSFEASGVYALLSVAAVEDIEVTESNDWNHETELTAQIILKAHEAMTEEPVDGNFIHSVALTLGLALERIRKGMEKYEKSNNVRKLHQQA